MKFPWYIPTTVGGSLLAGFCLGVLTTTCFRARDEHSEACRRVMATTITHDDTLRVRIACYLDGEDALRAVPYDPAVHPRTLDDTMWDR